MGNKLSLIRLLVILGPTSTGKTDLALQLAEKFNGELVSCDSRQVYKGLDIGTGKLPSNPTRGVRRAGPRGSIWEIDGIKIWLYDVASPKKQYTVADYVKDAEKAIGNIRERGKLPIIVGGSGFYLKALLEGLPNLIVLVDERLRAKLRKLSKEKLQEKLQQLSPDKWGNLNESDRQNPRRLVRYIEIASTNFTSEESLRATVRGGFNTLKIGLNTSREILYQRIDERLISRINQGLIDEARNLHKNGLSYKRMRELGLEYGILADYLAGKIAIREELIKRLQGKIHGYARRQITWFKNPSTGSGHIFWFDVSSLDFAGKVENIVTKWYYSN